MTQPGLAEREQFLLIGSSFLPQDHEGHSILAEIAVGYPDCSRFKHRQMRFENLIDLPRRDIDAAFDDQLLGAADDPKISILVLAREITSMQPPIAVYCRRSAFAILIVGFH